MHFSKLKMDIRILLFHLVVVFVHRVCSYQEHSITNLCPASILKTTLNRIMHNVPEVKLGFGENSAALIRHSWNSSNFKKFEDCQFYVSANQINLNESKRSVRGIYTSIRKLNLRETINNDGCVDYIRFIYAEDGRKTAKLCGHLNSNPSDLKKIFIDDEKGRIKVSIHFDRFLPMKRDEDTLDIELLFTAYGDCNEYQPTKICNDRQCIAPVFLNDGIVNCPPPDFSDEPITTLRSDPIPPNNTDIVISALTSLIFTLIGVGSCLWLCWHIKDCFVAEASPSGRSTTPTRRTNPTTRTTSLGAENRVLEIPAGSSHNMQPSSDFDEPKDDRPPSYDSLFPKGTEAKPSAPMADQSSP